jgi:hypothetical protein
MAKRRERKLIKLSIADAVSGAYSSLTDLGQELRDWADNIEEKFGSTDKYSRLDEAASTLEGLNEPTVPETLEKIEVEIMEAPYKRRGLSRPARRDQAVYELEAVVQDLQELIDEKADPKGDAELDTLLDDAETLINEIEDLKSEAEQVEFPGMYG